MSAHPKDGGLNVDVSGLLSHWASEFQDSAENSRSAMDRHAHSMHADQFRAAQQQVDKDSDEIARLRARVAKLESARGEPVAWMNPYGGTLQVRITGLEYEKYTIPLYTAPPAQAVDVDAISDEAIEREALRDAGRYRWLRGTIFLAAVDGYENSYRREKLDAFIDNAIDTDMRKTP